VSVSFAEPLANGKYTVAFQLTAADGDVVKSSYTFTVAAPVASSAPASATAASPAPVSETASTAVAGAVKDGEQVSDDSGTPWLGLAAGIGILALAAAAVLVFLRRRSAAGK
jgi:hypothetical protein